MLHYQLTYLEYLAQTSHCSLSTWKRYRLPMPICTEPLIEPYLSIECGHHLCRQCRDYSVLVKESAPCVVNQTFTNAVIEKYLQRKVNSLKVRCSNYKEGCEWVGELKTSTTTLILLREDVALLAPLSFLHSKYARRSEMREHSRRHCHKRMISCVTTTRSLSSQRSTTQYAHGLL